MDSALSVEERVKSVGIQAGALVVGIASADAFNEYVPAGHRPEDFLPGAKSVVVAAGVSPAPSSTRNTACSTTPRSSPRCPSIRIRR